MTHQVFIKAVFVAAASLIVAVPRANAVVFGGIDFPDGAISFADRVLRYDPALAGAPPSDPTTRNPLEALGLPRVSPPGQFVSIGHGGLLEVGFTDNVLTNSGNNGVFDLHVFEIGPAVEDTFVAIRPTAQTLPLLDPAADANGDGYFEIGKVFGGTSSIDLDVVFPGQAPGALRFDAVQLVDDYFEELSVPPGGSAGADIDAVGAITTAFTPGPTGTTPRDPLMPILIDLDGTFVFIGVPEARWYDPPLASGFEFETTDGSLFTEVGMPPLDVVPDTDGMYFVTSILGTQAVAAGGNLVFGSPVDFFTLSGIAPLVDGTNPQAFPTYLAFDHPTVSFTMTPIPEPASIAIAIMACVAIPLVRWRGAAR
jgi:hypothetical protein